MSKEQRDNMYTLAQEYIKKYEVTLSKLCTTQEQCINLQKEYDILKEKYHRELKKVERLQNQINDMADSDSE
jgi:hypothetical protein